MKKIRCNLTLKGGVSHHLCLQGLCPGCIHTPCRGSLPALDTVTVQLSVAPQWSPDDSYLQGNQEGLHDREWRDRRIWRVKRPFLLPTLWACLSSDSMWWFCLHTCLPSDICFSYDLGRFLKFSLSFQHSQKKMHNKANNTYFWENVVNIK